MKYTLAIVALFAAIAAAIAEEGALTAENFESELATVPEGEEELTAENFERELAGGGGSDPTEPPPGISYNPTRPALPYNPTRPPRNKPYNPTRPPLFKRLLGALTAENSESELATIPEGEEELTAASFERELVGGGSSDPTGAPPGISYNPTRPALSYNPTRPPRNKPYNPTRPPLFKRLLRHYGRGLRGSNAPASSADQEEK